MQFHESRDNLRVEPIDDTDQAAAAITELDALITGRITDLTTIAINARPAWLRPLGAQPDPGPDRDTWQRQLRALVAYRDVNRFHDVADAVASTLTTNTNRPTQRDPRARPMTTDHKSDFYPTPRTTFGPDRPICRARLHGDHATEVLDELTDWVQWLPHRFTLDPRTIPDCWDQHGPLIEELSALYTAWQTAYAPTAEGDAPFAWMNQFALARQRLTNWAARTGCRPGAHRGK